MRYLVIASACAALLATPALAQSNYDQAASPAPVAAPAQGCSTLPDAKAEPCPSNVKPDSAASLAAEHATGTIASIDVAANTITLDDGKMFGVPANVALNDLKVGQKVTIAFSEQGGKLTASDVMPAAPAGAN